MTLQRIIEELENIIEQSADDELIEKDAIVEALIDVVRNSKGDSLDFDMEDDDHFSSWQETDFSSLSDLDN